LLSSRSIRVRSGRKGVTVASVSVGAGGVGIGRGGSECCDGSVVVVNLDGGNSRSSVARLARISSWMAARSIGSRCSGSIGFVEEGMGEEREGSGCRNGGGVVVVVVIGGGKIRLIFARLARISA